jgi:hypothetical protein
MTANNEAAAQLPAPDWSRGDRDPENHTPEGLRYSARIALKQAREWIECAESLLAKANDLIALRARATETEQ